LLQKGLSRLAAAGFVFIAVLSCGSVHARPVYVSKSGDAGDGSNARPRAAIRKAAPEGAKNAPAALKNVPPFYKRHVVADGLLIVGSEKVAVRTLHEAAYLARKLLARRPDVMAELGRRNVRVCVMAYTEMQTDLPECRGMHPWWDFRARGLAGGTVSCGEENLLCLEGDPWGGENIFVHEFAHKLQAILGTVDKGFGKRLVGLFRKARKSGRFRGYAMVNEAEFWAEGVQSWFNCNREIRPKSGGGQPSFQVLTPDGKHLCYIATRRQLKTHMPEYAKLIDESFGRNEWVYVPPAKRLHEPHLRGFDPAKAPKFRFAPGVLEAFYLHEAEKDEQKRQRELRKKK
jgi:hypothetical protein